MWSFPATTVASSPAVIASRLPVEPAGVSIPIQDTPSIAPRMKPAIPRTTGMDPARPAS